MSRVIPILIAGALAIPLVGCESKTEGQRTVEHAKTIESAGHMIERGERMVAEGKAQFTRGETRRDQGDRIEGERIIGEGRAMQRQGQALIDEGRRMKN